MTVTAYQQVTQVLIDEPKTWLITGVAGFIGSVPHSIADPINTNHTNISGFLNMLVAARDAQVTSFTYAAVIPKWTAASIVGDEAKNQVYNVAVGGRTTLNTLFTALKDNLSTNGVQYIKAPIYRDFRAGDVRHSQADISKIQSALGYDPQFDIVQGIEKAMPWYVAFVQNSLALSPSC